jgi:hypothetical protein
MDVLSYHSRDFRLRQHGLEPELCVPLRVLPVTSTDAQLAEPARRTRMRKTALRLTGRTGFHVRIRDVSVGVISLKLYMY